MSAACSGVFLTSAVKEQRQLRRRGAVEPRFALPFPLRLQLPLQLPLLQPPLLRLELMLQLLGPQLQAGPAAARRKEQ